MSYTTEDWEYYLGRAYDTFSEAKDDDNLYRKVDKMAEGLMSLCEHLNVVQKEYLNNMRNTPKEE